MNDQELTPEEGSSGGENAQVNTGVQTIKSIAESLESIAESGRRTRKIVLALIISFVIDLMITFAIGVIASNSAMQSNAVQMLQYEQCISNNSTRADQINLWDFFLSLAEQPSPNSPKPGTEAYKHNQQEISRLLNFIKITFRQRKC